MKNAILVMVHLLARLAVLLGTGGTRAVLAENILLKQQLQVLQRSRRRAPNLRTADRWLFGFCAQFVSLRRLIRTAIILKPATLLRFHRAFKNFKYQFLYSSSPKKKSGPKGPSPELIRAICELKRRNPRFGCPKIAQHLAKTFGLDLDKDVVRRRRWTGLTDKLDLSGAADALTLLTTTHLASADAPEANSRRPTVCSSDGAKPAGIHEQCCCKRNRHGN
jgi:hypothetical protein